MNDNVEFVFGFSDNLPLRRLELTAQYKIKCSNIQNTMVRVTAQVTANSHSVGVIQIICDQGIVDLSLIYTIFTAHFIGYAMCYLI